MLDRRTAEFAVERECSRLLLDQNWRDGLIGDDAYLRSLMLLTRLCERHARTELALLKMERRPSAEDLRLEASRKWIVDRRQ